MTRNRSSLRKQPKAPPQYERVANALRATILAEDSGKPVRLPPDRDLCGIHGVSRATTRKAMDLLNREGLIERSPKRGTITIPAAIREWRHRRQSRVIHLLAGADYGTSTQEGFYDLVYQGIKRRCEQMGHELSIQRVMAVRTGVAMDLQLPDKDSTLGVICLGMMNEVMIRHYTDAGYPVVCADYWSINPMADSIVFDCYGEGQLAADFLLRQGHMELFYVGNLLGRQERFQRESDAELMLAGMQRVLVQAGLPPIPPERITFVRRLERRDKRISEWFQSLQPSPTAGVVFSGDTCHYFVESLRAEGIHYPEDISLISKACETEPTDMTCLRGNPRLLGEMAVDTLLDRASGRRSQAVRQAVPTVLVRGQSVRQL